ncbi:MAG: hypothetical protein QOE70_6792 [Chthoniobacter sp.]|jgi:hypothetical protein|nr:hypothetical protein [Chthoniobacter sp.]
MHGSLAIPDGLRQQFDELERRLWRFDTAVAICGGACSLLLSFALIFVSDRLWDTPPWLRAIFTGGGVVALGFFLYGYGRRWIWGSRSLPALASLVQKRYRRLGDRLLGIVELADERNRPANFSPALCRAAIGQVASEAAKVDFRQAVGTRRPRRYLFGVLAAAALATAFFVIAPQAGWNALWRWAFPTSPVERYTFVSLDHLPDHLVVAHGEPFEIAVGVSAHSWVRPTRITAQFERQTATEAPVRNGAALFRLPGQTHSGVLTLRAGDIKRQLRIEPAFRPELKQLTATSELPAYLQHPPLEQKIDRGVLPYLKGSSVAFTGQVSRALDRASLDASALRVEGDTFSSPPATFEGAAQLTFTWRDRLGLDAAAPAKVRLQPKEDAPPQVECRGLPAAIAILEEEVVRIDIAATDDFGLREVGARWQTASSRTGDVTGPLDERKLSEGEPQTRALVGRFDFSPALLRIPPETSVAFYATATDRFPNRPASVSAVHQIYVLSREAHARLIQDQLEKLLARLEELTRRQEALLEAGKKTRAQAPEKLANTDSEKSLAEQTAEEKETAAQLDRLAQQIAETLREAMRNKDLATPTLQDWAKHAQALQDLARQNMPAAAQSLNGAKSDVNSRASKLDQALAQEDEILKQLRGVQKAAEQSLDKLMTQNLAMRLRKIASAEQGIAGDFQRLLPETIGMNFEQLPPEPRQSVERMTASHETGRGESSRLHVEIGRLFERTKLARYGDVADGMAKADTDNELRKLGALIQQNVAVRAIQGATEWSRRFEEWANRLSAKDDSKSEAGEGEGKEANLRALMALLRLRQQEDALRQRTGALDRQKDSHPHYREEAAATAAQQEKVHAGLEALSEEPGFPIPPERLAPVGIAMGDAQTLLSKPDTGEPAIAAETDAINLLDELITAQCKKCGKSGKGLAGLMAMMGFGAGSSPGMSGAGGDTDRANVPVPGPREGRRPEERRVTQASGNERAAIPAEFREAIESYQRAIEGALP